jgi:proliferating cell nuclear antigen
MKITFEETNIFKEAINILASIINEGKFIFDGERLKLTAIDAANVCLVHLEFTKDSFLEAEGSGEFIVKMDELKDALKKAKKSDIITLELDEEKNRLRVILKGSMKRIYSIPLISEEIEEIPEPNLEDFKVTIELDSKSFKEAIESIETISDNTIFEATKEKFILRGGEELEEAIVEFDNMSESILKFEVQEESKAMYGNDYLKKVIKAYKIASTVLIQFATDYPLKLEYNNLDKNKIIFVIAPKLE